MYIYTYINNHIFKTKVLTTPEEIERGMMGKTFDQFDAALFVMNRETSSFWMKNCIVPLDVVFVHNNRITKIYSNCPPCVTETCTNYKGKGEFVFEFPGETCSTKNIRVGDKVYFINR